ncbi:hypothetical protein U9M48_008743, partial [Paspalum notatum var. saurae]
HIDPANEELPPDQQLIEEPEDETEDPHATADLTAGEAPSNPSGEVVAPSRVNVYDVGSSEIGVIEGRRPLDGLPDLVQLKGTASQRWQVH